MDGGNGPPIKEVNKALTKEDKIMATFTLNGTVYESNEKGNYFYKSTGKMDKKGNPIMMRIPRHIFEQAFEEMITESADQAKADAEYEERLQKQEKKDRETEQNFNGGKHEDTLPDGFTMKSTWDGDTYSYALYRGEELIGRFWDGKEAIAKAHEMLKAEKPKTKKAAKPRRSKDVAFEMDTIEGHITLTAKQVQFLKLLPKTCFWEEGVESTLWCDCIAEDIRWNPMSAGAMISTLREKKLVVVGRDESRKGKPKFMTLTTVGQVIAEKLGLH